MFSAGDDQYAAPGSQSFTAAKKLASDYFAQRYAKWRGELTVKVEY